MLHRLMKESTASHPSPDGYGMRISQIRRFSYGNRRSIGEEGTRKVPIFVQGKPEAIDGRARRRGLGWISAPTRWSSSRRFAGAGGGACNNFRGEPCPKSRYPDTTVHYLQYKYSARAVPGKGIIYTRLQTCNNSN